jgi:hypothetical protein
VGTGASKRSIFRENTSDRSYILSRQNNKNKNEKVLDYISDKGLGEIFDKFKKIKTKNSKNFNEFMDQNPETLCKPEMKKYLLFQEKCLKIMENNNKCVENLANFVSKQAGKSDEELLMNRTDGFRVKSEFKNLIESNKPLAERYGANSWVISLRRPKKFQGVRYSYINVGSTTAPIWSLVKEKVPENLNTETIRKPGSKSSKDIRNLTDNNFFRNTLTRLKIDTENVEGWDNLNVKKILNKNI